MQTIIRLRIAALYRMIRGVRTRRGAADGDRLSPHDAKPAGEQLTRRLGLADAVVVGLGSMLGAGVFASFAPAAAAAGAGLLIALAIAAMVA